MTIERRDMTVEIREKMRGGNGQAEITKLSGTLPGNVRLFAQIRLTPGSSIGYHVHEAETEMFAFVSGKGRVQDDDEFRSVSAGDSMITFPGHGHGVENTGDEDLILIAAIVKE
ncbi:MAG: cupin domain-containing protein [Clostridia bacterium]|nr:cupin domain-containing protein [Clostridia bacterium]